MPRGYLKHKPGVSRKAARGGGTHSTQFRKVYEESPSRARARQAMIQLDVGDETSYHRDEEYCDSIGPTFQGWTCSTCTFVNDHVDYLVCQACGSTRETDNLECTFSVKELELPIARTNENKKQDKKPTLTTCPICCEENVHVQWLMKNCQTHEPACYQCLRRVVVTDAQQNAANYPLVCYHPNCQRPIRETQVLPLCQTNKEIAKHFRWMELSKGRRKQWTHTVYCPKCDHPKMFSHYGKSLYRRIVCQCCSWHYDASPYETLVKTLEQLKPDSMGRNDGFAQCPNCKMLISKGDGCDHMRCGMCRWDFSWNEARARQGRRLIVNQSGQGQS